MVKTLLFCFYQFSIDFITRFVVSFLLFLILFSPIPVGVGRFFVCRHCAALRYKRQYRTKSVWRLCTPSACKFPVIFHKNAREYIKYSLRFLFHLTKNLTTHLSHNLCAVLPKIPVHHVRCTGILFDISKLFGNHFRQWLVHNLSVRSCTCPESGSQATAWINERIKLTCS